MYYKILGVRALIYHNKKLLILKRAGSDTDDAGLWDIPGGAVKSGESIFAALKREVLEETGIRPDELIIKDLREIIVDNFKGNQKLVIAIFVCESTVDKVGLDFEHEDYRWINVEEISSFKLGRVLKVIKL